MVLLLLFSINSTYNGFLLCAEKYSIRRNSIFSIRFFVDLDDLIVINIDLLFDLIVILNTVES